MKLSKVPKNDYVPEQHGPVYNFFYSLKTHFLTIMSVNLLFVIFNIPAILVAYFMTLFFLPYLNDMFTPANFVQYMYDAGVVGNTSINDVGTDAAYQLYYLVVVMCIMFLVGSTLVVVGPFQAGFSQIYRNLYRQEGVFLFTDFKEGMKNNLKQSIGASVISLVFTCICLFAIGFYGNTGTRFGTAAATFFAILFFVFIIVQNIVYTMMVSRDIKLSKIYKNAFLFFLLKFGPCLGLIVVMLVLFLLIPALLLLTTTYFAMAVVVFYYLVFVFAFMQYLLSFFTGELIKEYIAPMDPPKSEEDDDYGDDFDDEEEEDDGEAIS